MTNDGIDDETERRYLLIREEILRLFYKSNAIGQRREAVSANRAEENLIRNKLLPEVLNPGGNFSQEYYYLTHPKASERREAWAHVFQGLEDPSATPGQKAKAVRRFRPIPGREHLAPPPDDVLASHPKLIEMYPALRRLELTGPGAPVFHEADSAGTEERKSGSDAPLPPANAGRYTTARPTRPSVPVPAEVRDAVWAEAHDAHFDTQEAIAEAVSAGGADPMPDEYWDVAKPDIGWLTGSGVVWMCEAKSLISHESGKLRLGLGQILDYRTRVRATADARGHKVRAAVAVSALPRDLRHWLQVCADVQVALLVPGQGGRFQIPPELLT